MAPDCGEALVVGAIADPFGVTTGGGGGSAGVAGTACDDGALVVGWTLWVLAASAGAPGVASGP